MWAFIGNLFATLGGVLKVAFGPLFGYFMGRKAEKLDNLEDAFKEAQKSGKRKNKISNLDDDDLNSIVFKD